MDRQAMEQNIIDKLESLTIKELIEALLYFQQLIEQRKTEKHAGRLSSVKVLEVNHD